MISSAKEEAIRTATPRKESLSKEAAPYSIIKSIGDGPPCWQRRGVLFLVSLLVALILSPKLTFTTEILPVGTVARKNVKAPFDFLVEDVPSTKKKKEEVAATALPIYDFDDGASRGAAEKIARAFTHMRQLMAEIEGSVRNALSEKGETEHLDARKKELLSAYLEESSVERRQAFETELSVKLPDELFSLLDRKGFDREIEKAIAYALSQTMALGIVESRELLRRAEGKGIVVRNVKSQEERTVVVDLAKYPELADARSSTREGLTDGLAKAGLNRRDIPKLIAFADSLIRPTLTFNKNETERRKQAAIEATSPVYFQVKEGEMILREGERVTEEHAAKLKRLKESSLSQAHYINALGLFFMVAAMLYAIHYYATRNMRRSALDLRDLLFLSLMLLGTLGMFNLTLPVYDALSGAFPRIPNTAYQYLFTAAAGAILVRIVLSPETAFAFSVAVSILAALIMKGNLVFGIYTFIGCLMGAQAVRYCRYRFHLIRAGIYVGFANMGMALFIGLFSGDFYNVGSPFNLLFAFLGGVVTGVVVTGITPAVEWLFGYTTDFRLLELASLDHPLLKELITQAPGTYHHSWIIGNLVESAAEAINANPLLARVSALYHDVGKMKKPNYFYENQKKEKNPHDKLAPSLSSLILIGHVKDGIELAKEYKLGREITDIIPQHHGTRLISYFYQKAKNQEDPDVHEVSEKDYRYPGPKPQTKEAGLVMLADAVEAATRSLPEPTPARIQAMVKRLIGEIFADGQLDECELTLKDLTKIADSFNRILNGIYHARIEYPGGESGKEGDGKTNGNPPGGGKTPERGVKTRAKKEGAQNPPTLEFRRVGA